MASYTKNKTRRSNKNQQPRKKDKPQLLTDPLRYYKKSKEYFQTMRFLEERDILNSSTLNLAQLTIECCLSSIIEELSHKSMEEIYGKGMIPHDLYRLYGDCYRFNYEQTLPNFSTILRKELSKIFSDYKTARFPKEGYKQIDVNSVRFATSIANEVYSYCQERYEPMFHVLPKGMESTLQAEEELER